MEEAVLPVRGPAVEPVVDRPRSGTAVDGEQVLGALSPSRAGDFRACPLQYRLRTIDRLPEQPSPAAARGTVVHKVLQDLFDLPAAERTPERAEEMVAGAWQLVLDAEPELASVFGPPALSSERPEVTDWLASCRESVRGYFDLEDPRRLEPAEREVYIEALLESGLLLRGFVDRIDIARDGSVRIVDYKTGRSPGVGHESRALFQLRFYALVLWRTRRVLPTLLQLIYLGDGQVISYRPDEQDLRATERLVEALWRAIDEARSTGEWLPSPGFACGRCSFQHLCPAFGNEPPPLPGPPEPVSAIAAAAAGSVP